MVLRQGQPHHQQHPLHILHLDPHGPCQQLQQHRERSVNKASCNECLTSNNWRGGPFICLIVVVFHRSFTDASPRLWPAEWRPFWHNCYLQECQQWLWLRQRLTWMPTQDCGVLMFRSAQADCRLWKRMQMGRLRLYMFCWVLSINSSRQRRTRSLAVRQNSLMVSVHNMSVRLLGHIKAAVHRISSLSFFKLLLKSWCSFDVFSKGIERQSDPCPQCYFTNFWFIIIYLSVHCLEEKKKGLPPRCAYVLCSIKSALFLAFCMFGSSLRMLTVNLAFQIFLRHPEPRDSPFLLNWLKFTTGCLTKHILRGIVLSCNV